MLVLAGLLCVGLARAGAAQAMQAEDAQSLTALAEAASAELGLQQSTVVALSPESLATPPATTVSILVPADTGALTLQLVPHSVRSDAYEVKLQLADGSYMDVKPGPIRTYRGVVEGAEGSSVAASIQSDGLHARIRIPGEGVYWVEPIGARVAGAAASHHVLYHEQDILPSEAQCLARQVPGGAESVQSEEGTVAATGLFFAELAVDVDYEYYLLFQGQADPIDAVEAHVNSVINAVNQQQYEPQVAIRHVITTIIIRTAEPDPYYRVCVGGPNASRPCVGASDCPSGSCRADPDTLLFQFGEHWATEQTGVRRDVAQLFTGKDLYGSTVGIAWVRTVCNVLYGYSVVQTNCCSLFSCKTDLSAHELGHNWAADHCACPGYTMNASLQCANRFHGTFDIPEITAHRDSRSCVDKGNELRRIIVLAQAITVAEGDTLQLTAIADFAYGEDPDITSEATWTVSPASAGFVDSSGLMHTSDVTGNTCVTVRAAYEYDGVLHTKDRIILIEDQNVPLRVESSDPLADEIDAREPFRPDGTYPVGWRAIEMTFNGDACLMTGNDFSASQVGGTLPPPAISSFQQTGPRSARLVLNRDIEPGAWTTVTHLGSGAFVRVGYLPDDVTGNGVVDATDIRELVDAIRGTGDSRPESATDLDRSGRTAARDLLRGIDLFRGAESFEAWAGRSLP